MDAEIASCYTSVVSCKSEDYWWTDQDQFGDGKFMLNKVYVKKELQVNVKKSFAINLTTAEMTAGGLNPRCASAAQITIPAENDETSDVLIASLHLSGGYVDDEVAKAQIRAADVKDWLLNLRRLQLQTMVTALERHNVPNVIIGGDTNGFPAGSVDSCQGGRITWMASEIKEELGDEINAAHIERDFKAYITTPNGAGDCTRVPDGVQDDQSCDMSPNDPRYSTTIWGGRVDAFFTNVARASARIQPVGFGSNTDKRNGLGAFYRILSDHNPVWLTMALPDSKSVLAPLMSKNADLFPSDQPVCEERPGGANCDTAMEALYQACRQGVQGHELSSSVFRNARSKERASLM
jgi:hypothetical protein